MEPEVCVSAPEALDLTVVRHYSALVLDFDLPGAATVARMARLAPSSRRPVIFGMIGASTEIAETFQAGVNFIIYKPLAFEQVVRCLRAGRGFMRPDRRQSQRQPLESLVYLQFGIAALPAMVLDLNQDGLALQAPDPCRRFSKCLCALCCPAPPIWWKAWARLSGPTMADAPACFSPNLLRFHESI